MAISQKLIPVLAITAGALLLITGVGFVFAYANSALEVWNSPDQSVLFWYLPLLFMGFISSASGIYFLLIGIKSFSQPPYHKLASSSLIILSVLIAVLSLFVIIQNYRAEKFRAKIVDQQKILAGLQKIRRISVTDADADGMLLQLYTNGTHTGRYRLSLQVKNQRTDFMEFHKNIRLDSTDNHLTEYIPFDTLFDICKDEPVNTRIYVCVENAGTSNSEFNIRAQLQPEPEDLNDPYQPDSSENTASFFLDTIHENGTVRITSVTTDNSGG